MKPRQRILWMACLVLLAASGAAFAEPGRGGVSLSAALTPIGNGDAGDGRNAPQYNDAFDAGWTARIEPYYDFHPMIRGQFGVAYNRWAGATYVDTKFSDLKILTYYVGAKVRFRPGAAVRPYVVADIGAAHIDAVDISGPAVTGGKQRYWGSTLTAFIDFGGGVEFQAGPNVSFFLDARLQGTGAPHSEYGPASDADGVGSVPLSAGVNISF
jgi:Outer membrane protein beta-barrel domain